MQRSDFARRVRPRSVLLAAIGLSALVVGSPGAGTSAQPPVVYVADFDLETKHIKAEKKPLPPLPPPPGPLGRVLPKPPGEAKDPAASGRELVELIATSLVDELSKAGLTARRLRPGTPRPSTGWLVRGVFTQVDEGDQVRRAVIGFGAGKTQVRVVAVVDDLSRGDPKPFYEVSVGAESGRMPGAGPLIVFAPPAGAARFMLAGRDLERNVKQTAAKIAADVAARVPK